MRPFPEAPMSEFHALIPAAGSGTRMGSETPKQYLSVNGKPMLAHSVARFADCAAIAAVHVVIAPDDAWFDRCDWTPWQHRLRVYRCGGATRAASVLNGLRAMAGTVRADDWVLVHDAARPCLSRAQLERLIEELKDDHVGGLLAIPLADTLKRAGDFRRIDRTEVRDKLWQAQTPQMFRYALLLRALEAAADQAPTDEACAVEQLGLRPRLVASDLRNLKVTFPEDVELAELILMSQRG